MADVSGRLVPERVAATVLVNSRGDLLLQLRDGNTAVSPNRWGLVGGGLEEGEDPTAGALRELVEETGLTTDEELTLIGQGSWPASLGPGQTEWWVFGAATAASADQIEIHEGQDITFAPARDVAALDLSASAVRFLCPSLALGRIRSSPSEPLK